MIDTSNITGTDMFLKAFEVASKAHEGATHARNEPFIQHPLRVVAILEEFTDLNRSKEEHNYILQAAMMHDVVEDTEVSLTDLSDMGFEDDCVDLVRQLTLDLPKNCSPLPKWEVKHWMLLGHASQMTWDAAIIKLADRLDNLRSFEGNDNRSDFIKKVYSESGVALGKVLEYRVIEYADVVSYVGSAAYMLCNIIFEARKYSDEV